MNKVLWGLVAVSVALAISAGAQNPRTQGGPTRPRMSNPAPGAAAPDSGLLKPGSQEAAGSRAEELTPATPDKPGTSESPADKVPAAGNRPITTPDCANNGWKSYSNPRFRSQKGCEAWLLKHPFPANPLEVEPPADSRTVIPLRASHVARSPLAPAA